MADDNKHAVNNEQPEAYGFWKTVLIVLCGHLGVRTTAQRKTDFERANGVHVFAVAVMYFLLVIIALIALVNYIARQ
ncbi:MAG: DUF2970 domain-containing protein [Gammaproteobacteria bacterium]|nr:DUF2970 domain-containing protein [Gammaproteobacteria bacterium]MBQ0840669.1 DUF2970 domain-containing protein [Gammaproteobacteria bacterium]